MLNYISRIRFFQILMGFIAGATSSRATSAQIPPIRTHSGDGSISDPFVQRTANGPLDDVRSYLLCARLELNKNGRINHIFPGYSSCGRCGLPWPIVRSHTTIYTRSSGCFPLCEDCWSELRAPANRMPYYEKLLKEWGPQGRKDMDAIREAVRAGL